MANKTNKDEAATTIAAPAATSNDNGSLTAAAANGSLTLYRKSNKAKTSNSNGNGKYTRVHAVCEVLKENPGISRDDCLLKADSLFTEKTGTASNMPETYRRYRSTVHVLKLFGVL